MQNFVVHYQTNTHQQFKALDGVDKGTISFTENLDEDFNYGSFNVLESKVKLQPKTRLEIFEYADTVLLRQSNWIVSGISETQKRFVNGAELYDFQVTFVENTALLQNDITDTIAVTQPLPSVWQDTFTPVNAVINSDRASNRYLEYPSGNVPNIYSLNFSAGQAGTITGGFVEGSTILLPLFDRKKTHGTSTLVSDNDYYIRVRNSNNAVVVEGLYSAIGSTLTLTAGYYTLEFYWQQATISNQNVRFFYYQIQVVPSSGNKYTELDDRFFTAKEACEKLLNTVNTLFLDESAKYTLNASAAAKLSQVVTPDLYYTGNTLYQNLLLIGRQIHAIPRMVEDSWTELTFTFLDGVESVPDGTNDVKNGEIHVGDYEGFVGGTVSNLENMVASNKFTNPTIKDTWRTLKGKDNARITADTAVYKSDFPIYQVRDLKINYNDLGERSIGQYIYESAVYQCLSKTSTMTYNSIAYALSYAQGGSTIEGFVGTLENQTYSISNPPAFCRILNLVYGVPINNTLISDWLNTKFQLEYVPKFAARLKTFRADAARFNTDTILLNQQVNVGSVEAVGDSFRGSLMQLGNDTVSVSRFFDEGVTLPHIGQSATLNGGRYMLSQMTRAWTPVGYAVEMIYSKNFNRISAITSLSTEKRYAEVSEKSAIARTINIDEYIVVGDSTYVYDGTFAADGTPNKQKVLQPLGVGVQPDTLLTQNGWTMASYESSSEGDGCIRSARLLTRDKDGNNAILDNTFGLAVTSASRLLLPANATAFGNSIAFTFAMKDNYSAGSAEVSNNGFNFSVDVPYADQYGTFKSMALQLCSGSPTVSFADAKTLPLFNGGWESSPLIDGSTRPVLVEKDGREALSVVYQIHFVTNNPRIVLGGAYARLNPLVYGKTFVHSNVTFSQALINRKVNEFNTEINEEEILYRNYISVGFDTSLMSQITIRDHRGTATEYCNAIIAEYDLKRVDGVLIHRCEVLFGRNGPANDVAGIVHTTPLHSITNLVFND